MNQASAPEDPHAAWPRELTARHTGPRRRAYAYPTLLFVLSALALSVFGFSVQIDRDGLAGDYLRSDGPEVQITVESQQTWSVWLETRPGAERSSELQSALDSARVRVDVVPVSGGDELAKKLPTGGSYRATTDDGQRLGFGAGDFDLAPGEYRVYVPAAGPDAEEAIAGFAVAPAPDRPPLTVLIVAAALMLVSIVWAVWLRARRARVRDRFVADVLADPGNSVTADHRM